MRAPRLWALTFLAAVAIPASRPTEVLAQGPVVRAGQQATVVVHVVVPSVVKYVVDQAVRGPDGAPTVRVVTNDPAIRAAYARALAPERALLRLAQGSPEASGHAKGGDALESAPEEATVLRYTVVAP